MPISGAYTLDLYCDCIKCSLNPNLAFNQGYCDRNNLVCGFSQFYGESYSDAAKEARRLGWYISRDRQTVFAPGHKHR